MVAIAAVFLAVGMLTPMGAGAGAAEPTANDIVDAIDDVESYEYDTEMNSSSTSVVDGEEQETQSEGEGSGEVNVTAGEMKEEMATETSGDEVPEEGSFETQAYLVDGTYYTGTTSPGEDTEWLQLDAPENGSITEGPLTQYKSLLNASDVETVGQEQVDGTETHVLELDVDTEAYMQEMMAELGSDNLNGANGNLDAANGNNTTDAAVNESEDIVQPDQNMTVTLWVDCETDLPVKAELTSETVMEDLGTNEANNASGNMSEIESIETTTTQTTYFEAYDEPVSIELPEEAENAQTLEEQLENIETGATGNASDVDTNENGDLAGNEGGSVNDTEEPDGDKADSDC